MSEEAVIILECCQTPASMRLAHWEAPSLPENHFRKNITCRRCRKLVIVDLIKTGDHFTTYQEIIDLGD